MLHTSMLTQLDQLQALGMVGFWPGDMWEPANQAQRIAGCTHQQRMYCCTQGPACQMTSLPHGLLNFIGQTLNHMWQAGQVPRPDGSQRPVCCNCLQCPPASYPAPTAAALHARTRAG